jgi:hypothetical protein
MTLSIMTFGRKTFSIVTLRIRIRYDILLCYDMVNVIHVNNVMLNVKILNVTFLNMAMLRIVMLNIVF